jgi:hypothetical protein
MKKWADAGLETANSTSFGAPEFSDISEMKGSGAELGTLVRNRLSGAQNGSAWKMEILTYAVHRFGAGPA